LKKTTLLLLITLLSISLTANDNINDFKDDIALEICQESYSQCMEKCDFVNETLKREQCDDKCDIHYSDCLDKIMSK